MLVAPLLAAGVGDEVAQELQMPVGPQMLDDVEEPDRIVMEQHNLTQFPCQP